MAAPSTLMEVKVENCCKNCGEQPVIGTLTLRWQTRTSADPLTTERQLCAKCERAAVYFWELYMVSGQGMSSVWVPLPPEPLPMMATPPRLAYEDDDLPFQDLPNTLYRCIHPGCPNNRPWWSENLLSIRRHFLSTGHHYQTAP